MRGKELFFKIYLLKDESFILLVWFWILECANMEENEETILLSDYKNICES